MLIPTTIYKATEMLTSVAKRRIYEVRYIYKTLPRVTTPHVTARYCCEPSVIALFITFNFILSNNISVNMEGAELIEYYSKVYLTLG